MKKGLLLTIVASTVMYAGGGGGGASQQILKKDNIIPVIGSSQHGLLMSQSSSTLWQYEKAIGCDQTVMTIDVKKITMVDEGKMQRVWTEGSDLLLVLDDSNIDNRGTIGAKVIFGGKIADSGTAHGTNAVKTDKIPMMDMVGMFASGAGDGIMVETLFGGKSQKAAINSLFYRHLLTA